MRLHAERWLPLVLLIVAAPAAAEPPGPPSAEQAPIALLVDASSGQTLFARRAETRFLPASMTKAMTALVAFDLIRAGRLDEQALVTVRPATASRLSGKGTSLYLKPNERIRIADLLRGVVTASANDAAAVLAEAALGSQQAWHQAMNQRARALGMTGSHFASANGLPDGGKTYVTAADMARLGQALVREYPELYQRYFRAKEMTWNGHRLFSRNPLSGVVAGADGIKTGHTREAGYTFLGSVMRDGRRLVLVVGKTPSEAIRARASRDLVEWGFAAWDSRLFLAAGREVGWIKVQNGTAREVPVTVPRDYSMAVPSGTNPAVRAEIHYTGPVRAPIAKGSPVATLEVRIEGQPAYRLPLLTTKSVAAAGPIDRIVNGLLGLWE